MSTERKLPELVRTVTPGYRARPDNEMHAIGLLYAAVLLILVVPLLPFVAVFWLVSRLIDGVRSLTGGDEVTDESRGGRRPAG
jgi:hypothetical protein